MTEPPEKLPLHGFVLAGGQSSRMGTDKARLEFFGWLMVELAVAKLRRFCTNVSIVGNRNDLDQFAPVIRESRTGVGPGAGLEAGLLSSKQPWAMFIPVDVPLMPAHLLWYWATSFPSDVCSAGTLVMGGEPQPAFCLLDRNASSAITAALDAGKQRLNDLLRAPEEAGMGGFLPMDAAMFEPSLSSDVVAAWFSNINTPEDLARAEAWAKAAGWNPGH